MGPIQDRHLDQIKTKISEFIGNNEKVTHDTRVWVKLKRDNSGKIEVFIGIKPQEDGYVKVPNRLVSKCLKDSIKMQILNNEPSSLSGRIEKMQSFRTKIKPNFFSRLVKSKTPEKDLAKNLIKEDVIAKLKKQGIDDPSSKQVKHYVNLRIKYDDDIKYFNNGDTHSISSYVYFLKQTSKTILIPEEIEKFEGTHTVTNSIHDLVAEADRKNISINYTTYGLQSKLLPTVDNKPGDPEVKRELWLLGINFNPTEKKSEDLFRSICKNKLNMQYPRKYSNEKANEIAEELYNIRFSAQNEIKALNNQLNQISKKVLL